MGKNRNCLEGMRCPECKSREPFKIEATAMFEVFDNGTEDFVDAEWSNASYCECYECGHTGIVIDFKKKGKKK